MILFQLGLKMVLLLIIVNIMFRFLFNTKNYMDFIVNRLIGAVKRIFDNFIFTILFLFIFYQNVYGNIFYCLIPTLNYINTVHIRLIYFVPIVIIIIVKQYVNFVKHMIPYGAPL